MTPPSAAARAVLAVLKYSPCTMAHVNIEHGTDRGQPSSSLSQDPRATPAPGAGMALGYPARVWSCAGCKAVHTPDFLVALKRLRAEREVYRVDGKIDHLCNS